MFVSVHLQWCWTKEPSSVSVPSSEIRVVRWFCCKHIFRFTASQFRSVRLCCLLLSTHFSICSVFMPYRATFLVAPNWKKTSFKECTDLFDWKFCTSKSYSFLCGDDEFDPFCGTRYAWSSSLLFLLPWLSSQCEKIYSLVMLCRVNQATAVCCSALTMVFILFIPCTFRPFPLWPNACRSDRTKTFHRKFSKSSFASTSCQMCSVLLLTSAFTGKFAERNRRAPVVTLNSQQFSPSFYDALEGLPTSDSRPKCVLLTPWKAIHVFWFSAAIWFNQVFISFAKYENCNMRWKVPRVGWSYVLTSV